MQRKQNVFVFQIKLKQIIMKTKVLTLIMPFLFTVIAGFAGNMNNSQSDDKKEVRNVSNFSEISISVAGDVELSQGNEYKVVLEGDEDMLEKIETEVKGEELKIKYKSRINFGWNTDKVKIYITTKKVEEISVAGSATIKAQTKIKASEMEFNVSGSGKIYVDNLEASTIEANISGSGNISIGGEETAKSLDVSISGSGDLNAENIKKGEIDISGSGRCKVHIKDSLEADISGSGRVYYKGSPLINAQISGSGKVRSMN